MQARSLVPASLAERGQEVRPLESQAADLEKIITGSVVNGVDCLDWRAAMLSPKRPPESAAILPKGGFNVRLWVRLTALFLLGAIVNANALAAQLGDSPNRMELHRADLSGAPDMEVISSIVRVKPGQTIPAHSHHGIEAGYVLQGAMVQYPGHPPQMLKTGTPVFNLRDVVHSGFKVVGPQTLVIFTVHVVDKGKPLYQLAHKPTP